MCPLSSFENILYLLHWANKRLFAKSNTIRKKSSYPAYSSAKHNKTPLSSPQLVILRMSSYKMYFRFHL